MEKQKKMKIKARETEAVKRERGKPSTFDKNI